MLVGCELEFVLTQADGSALSGRPWNAYGLSSVLDAEPFLTDLVQACAEASLPVEQIHAEYGNGQFEFAIAPSDPITAADHVVLARLLTGRVARRHGFGVSFSPLPFEGGSGNGAHQHLSLMLEGQPLLSGGDGPHGLCDHGGAAIAGIVSGLPEMIAVLAGSVLSSQRLQPGHWSGASACWGLENREAALRFCAATPGNPYGASLEVKCIDPSANPYLSTAVIVGLALNGITANLALPAEVVGDPTTQTEAEAAASGTVRLAPDQGAALDALAASALAPVLLGEDILDATLAVRRHELDTYGKDTTAELAERFRFAWSA
jgi:glutamine synthetase